MTSKEVKALFVMLILMVAAFTAQSGMLIHNQGEIQDNQVLIQDKQRTLEESHEEELNSIYQLLAAAAFTNRTNMNLASKTNHYITHPKGQLGEGPSVACEECWKHFEDIATNMPTLPPANEAYYDAFYRKPYESLKKLREEKIK